MQVVRLTFSREVGGDAGLGPPPVRPGALILPGWREEGNRGESLRRERERDRRRGRSFIRVGGGRRAAEGRQKQSRHRSTCDVKEGPQVQTGSQ